MRTEIFRIRARVPENLTFAFVSDIHEANCGPVLEQIDVWSPDAVLIGGDFVHSPSRYRRGIRFLADVSERFPTFCSIGNHELRLLGRLPELTAGTKTVFLHNSFVRFRGIVIGGLSSGEGNGVRRGRFARTAEPDAAWLNRFCAEDGFKLLLSHHPEYFDAYIRPLPVELTLSGHAHGGQWRFFGRGLFAPGQGIFPKYTSGLYDGRLLVSRGIGNPHPVPRINNSPELIRLCLERTELV